MYFEMLFLRLLGLTLTCCLLAGPSIAFSQILSWENTPTYSIISSLSDSIYGFNVAPDVCATTFGASRSEICAQWKAVEVAERSVAVADRQFWAGIFLGVLTLASAVSAVIYAALAARYTRRGADVAQEIGQAQISPYLSITAARAFIDKEDAITVSVSVKNSGLTPARNVHVILSIYVNQLVQVPDEPEGWMTVAVFSRPFDLPDIATMETLSSGLHKSSDLSFPLRVQRGDHNLIRPGLGQVGVFAEDIFGNKIFESRSVLVASGQEEFKNWEQFGNFNFHLPRVFGDTSALKSRGWREYEKQIFSNPF